MTRRLGVLLIMGMLAGCVTGIDGKRNVKADKIQLAETRIVLGLAYLDEGQWERARYNLEIAVQAAPEYYRSRISFAHYLEEVGEISQAEAQYKVAIRFSPKNGDVQNNYGVFLCRQSRFSQAQRAFAKAVEMPFYYKLSSTYENAALCAFKEGNIKEAKILFKKAIAHEPNRPISTLQLANMEVVDDELNDARSRLFNLHKQYGYGSSSLLMMIVLENKAKRANEVEKYAHLLALRFPESKEYRQYLANEY